MAEIVSFVPSDWPWFHYVHRSFEWTGTTVRAELRYALSTGPEVDSTAIQLSETYEWHIATPKPGAIVDGAFADGVFVDGDWATRWDIAEQLLTHLWLVAGLSYYKMAAADNVRVHSFALEESDVALHKLLLRHGLGEFCFANNLDPTLNPTWTYETRPLSAPSVGASFENGPLVPVGGGKDSCVTIEALRLAARVPTLVTVRRFPIIQDVINDSGLADLQVDRTLDPSIGALNKAGALNGHVPATAIVSFAAMIGAVFGGHDALVMSNERSASEGNVEYRGVSINHQWAKSDEAEQAIGAAVARITPELRWFSLLRPLSELDISRRFALTCQRYLGSFSSCNRTQRIDPNRRVTRWCGECPKCQFVYLALSTALDRSVVEDIWGTDLFATSPIDGFRALLGLSEWKPFECVGEHLECQVALQQISANPQWANHPVLMQLANEVATGVGWPSVEQRTEVYTAQPAPLIPSDYQDVITQAVITQDVIT
jgi:UDP-N-acetyl-alpha-D-muramoyl-L-alanyl-L-glutamate epimerase